MVYDKSALALLFVKFPCVALDSLLAEFEKQFVKVEVVWFYPAIGGVFYVGESELVEFREAFAVILCLSLFTILSVAYARYQEYARS